MSELAVYHRTDGRIGIRNHIFVLPAVVCANQVAIDVARKYPNIKYIEHQHGCGQFGDDLENTRAAFVKMAVHPNVYTSLLVGLGCESISSRVVAKRAQNEHKQKVELVVIQDAGGTLNAGSLVEKWAIETGRYAVSESRTGGSWHDLIIGLLFENENIANSSTTKKIIATLLELGVHLVVPESAAGTLESFASNLPITNYGEQAFAEAWAVRGQTSPLESSTGLSVAGAHLIIHLVSQPHAFGNPLAPIARWCVKEAVYRQFPEDFDGVLLPDLSKTVFLDLLTEFINGKPTVAEQLGMDDFALYRIGPTV